MSEMDDRIARAPWHPASEAWPMIPEKRSKGEPMSLEELAESVKKNGLLQPVKYWVDARGKIWRVDGRNRTAACELAGVKPRYEQVKLKAGQSILDWINVANGDRRHMKASQKALAAAKLLPLYEAEAKERQREAAKVGRGEKKAPKQAEPPEDRKATARAAKVTGASTRNTATAKKVLAEAPDLAEKVEKEGMTLHTAEKIIRKRAQQAVLSDAAEKVGDPGEGKTWVVEAGDVVEKLGGLTAGVANLIFVDPPYNQGVDYGRGKKADFLPEEQYLAWCREWVSLCVTALAPHGTLVLLTPCRWFGTFQAMLAEGGLFGRKCIVWYESFGQASSSGTNFGSCHRHILYCVKDKNKFTFNEAAVTRPDGKIWDDVWGINPPIPRLVENSAERLLDFPTQLPKVLLRPLIECFSNPGDLVLDPLCGSATTGEVCIETGRIFSGFDASEKFVEAARARLRLASTRVAKALKRRTQAPAGSEVDAESETAGPAPEANGTAKKAKKSKQVVEELATAATPAE
jgi:adenine-specific DNA-methyltransferase